MLMNKTIPESEVKPLHHVEITLPVKRMTPKDLQLCVDLDWNTVTYPCIVEPKIDGFRCLVTVDEDGTVHAWSRSGAEWPKVAAALSELSYFTGCWFDGELVIGGSWATTNAAMKRGEFDPDDLQFTVFDGDDLARLHIWLLDFGRVSLSQWARCRDRAEVECQFEKALADGHEGIVVKRLGATYARGRSGNWLKLKPQATRDVFENGRWLEKSGNNITRIREFDR